MKRLFFIWFFIPLILYCQTDSEFKLQNSIPVEWGSNCISKTDCFDLSSGNSLIFNDEDDYEYYYTLYYSYENENENKQVLVTGDWTDLTYGSTLNSFKYEKDNSYIVLWKIEGEFVPTFYAYYVKDGKIMKIGEWVLFVPCKTCETVNYLIEDIKIFQNDDEIEFIFLKETSFVAYKDLSKSLDDEDWGSFQARELIVSFNIVDGTVKRVEK